MTTISKETLAELERACVSRNPLLADRLRPGLPPAKIRSKLKRMGVSGEIEVVVDLYAWHNGTITDDKYVLSKKGIFPGQPFHFPLLDLAAAHFMGFRGFAATRPQLSEAVGRYFPVLWNGVVSWIAVDISGQSDRVVIIELEPTPAIREAYSSVAEFIEDLISANLEDRTLKCFSRKRASSKKKQQRSVVPPPVAPERAEAVAPPEGIECFASDGGPHIVLPDSARGAWKGVGDNYDVLDPSTDYGRACLVKEPVGLLSVGNQQALVLAGSPPMSGWRRESDAIVDLLVFDGWGEEGPEALAEPIIPKLRSSDFADTGLRWTVEDDGATLMSAADRPGGGAYGEVPVPLRSGTYSVLQARYEGDEGAFWVFRLAPSQSK